MRIYFLAIPVILALFGCGQKKPGITSIAFEVTEKSDWSNFNICFEEIPANYISDSTVAFYSKIDFVTKSNKTYRSRGTIIGRLNQQCMTVDCRGLDYYGLSAEDKKNLKNEMRQNKIQSVKIQLFEDLHLKNLIEEKQLSQIGTMPYDEKYHESMVESVWTRKLLDSAKKTK